MNTLTIYLKSGNTIRLSFIKEWTIRTSGNTVTHLEIKRLGIFDWLPTKKLLVASIDLSQIEAITKN
jgi:hypothetical protein